MLLNTGLGVFLLSAPILTRQQGCWQPLQSYPRRNSVSFKDLTQQTERLQLQIFGLQELAEWLTRQQGCRQPCWTKHQFPTQMTKLLHTTYYYRLQQTFGLLELACVDNQLLWWLQMSKCLLQQQSVCLQSVCRLQSLELALLAVCIGCVNEWLGSTSKHAKILLLTVM